jgi:hypothetical protein
MGSSVAIVSYLVMAAEALMREYEKPLFTIYR